MVGLTIEESISKLKINLIRRRPFYGVILMKLNELRESDAIDIASTDGNTIFYNREYMESLTESERNFYLLHQLYHCIFMHPTRMVNKDSKVANIAADYLVNYYIDMEKEEFRRNQIMITPPKDALMVESQEDKDLLEKLSFEQLYEILYKNMINIDADIIEGNFTTTLDKFNNELNIKNSIDKKNIKVFNTEKALEELIISRKFHQTPWNKLYKTELLKDIRFPDGKYIDDEYWTYKLFLNAKRISTLDLITYYYRQHDSSTMGKSYSVRRLDSIDALYERYLIIKEKFPNLEYLALKSFLLCCIYNFQKLCMSRDLDKNKFYREEIMIKFNCLIKESDLSKFSTKEKVLIKSFYKTPYMTSKIRNTLGRGI